MKLSEKVAQLLAQEVNKLEMYVRHCVVETTACALMLMTYDQHIEFVQEILRIWKEVDREEIYALLGRSRLVENTIGKPLYCTLTADRKQFRVWYGKHGYVERDHIDSGYLFLSVTGTQFAIEKLVSLVAPNMKLVKSSHDVPYWISE